MGGKKSQNKTKQNKTKQNKTKQNKNKQNKQTNKQTKNIIRNSNSGIFTGIQIPGQWMQCVIMEGGGGMGKRRKMQNVLHMELW